MRRTLLALTAFLLTAAAPGPDAGGRPARRTERAESAYQRGVSEYAAGDFDAARARFEEAVRLDPAHRSARASLARLKVETRGRVLEEPARPAARPTAAAEPDLLGSVAAFLEFEETLGDAARDQGEAQAELGRLAQWTAERRLARSRGLAYPREAELHARSRRLPALLRS